MLIQLGARRDVCGYCGELAIVAEFWLLAPLVRVFICAGCLKRSAVAVEQAAPVVIAREEGRWPQ